MPDELLIVEADFIILGCLEPLAEVIGRCKALFIITVGVVVIVVGIVIIIIVGRVNIVIVVIVIFTV